VRAWPQPQPQRMAAPVFGIYIFWYGISGMVWYGIFWLEV